MCIRDRVYVAFDPDLDRTVAVKVLHVGSDRAQERLLREARAMARLSHPNVVPVHEVGSFDGGRFVAMELIEGGTLGTWADRRGWREILRACIGAGRGLQAAHEAGLIHRDFKPANVLCDADGRARVTDFGLVLARAETETTVDVGDRVDDSEPPSEGLTQTGWAVGTPAYMAPEQSSKAVVDERSDQFSFCVTTWQALCSEHPWGGGRARTPAPRWPPSAPRVPRGVVGALLRGLSLDPVDRWPSMAALLEALEAASAPPRRGLRALLILAPLGSAGLAAAVFLSRPPDDAPCEDAGRHLEGVWDGQRRSQVGNALAESGATHGPDTAARTQVLLDMYSQAWVETHQRACLASQRGEQSEALLDQKIGCLQTRRAELRALVDILAAADRSTASRAVSAARELSPLDRCEDVVALQESAWTAEPHQVQLLGRVRDKVTRARALHSAGQYADGLAEARSAVALAEELGGAPVRDEADYMEGVLLDSVGEYEAAAEVLTAAALDAQRLGHHTTAAKASTMLVSVLGGRLGRSAEAATWALHADVAIEQARLGRSWESRLHTNLGAAYNVAGDFDKASVELTRAMSLAAEPEGETDNIDEAAATAEMASLHQSRGHYEEALRLHRRAAELAARARGTGHPQVATEFDNVGNALSALGRFEEALSFHERALEIFAHQGFDHPSYRAALSNLGSTQLSAGRLDEAVETFERVAKSASRSGHDPLNTAVAYVNVAGALGSVERYDEAVTYAQRGARGLEDRLGPEHPFVASALINLGLSQLGAQRPAAARRSFRRALEIADGQEFPPADLATARFGLARALGPSPEARRLAQEAGSAFAAAGQEDEAARVEAFLAP